MTSAENPHAVRLATFRFRVRERFRYEYDFHDDWQHDVCVERILPVEPGGPTPCALAASSVAPPDSYAFKNIAAIEYI
jgi:hypothetical protein